MTELRLIQGGRTRKRIVRLHSMQLGDFANALLDVESDLDSFFKKLDDPELDRKCKERRLALGIEDNKSDLL